MTSKIKSDGVQYSSCRVNLPSLQRSQAFDNEHKQTQVFNSVTCLDSGLGGGTVCSSVDVNNDTNSTECVSLVNMHKPGEDAVHEIYEGEEVDFIDKGCDIETLPSEKRLESDNEANICSEEDLLNFTFKVCDTEGTGKVPTSVIVRYLQEMTGQSYKYGRLHVLYNMLDPNKRDVAVDRERFHSTMKRWIATCCQEGPSDDKADMREHSSVQSIDREETSHVMSGILEEEMGSSKIYFQSDHKFTMRTGSFSNRETNELISDVADLKYANQKLREQNASFQKAMELSDETNLQLTKELSKLKGQLMSSQSSLRSLKSMVEDLEEARTTGRDAQEKVCQLQIHCKELKKENEVLVAQLWAVFEKNEKIVKDKRKLNYQIDELLTENADLTKQIHEAQNLLISKDAIIFEETVLIEELKMSNEESRKIIVGLRAELKASQGKVSQDFFGRKIGLVKSSSKLPVVCPVQSEISLQLEIQDSQKRFILNCLLSCFITDIQTLLRNLVVHYQEHKGQAEETEGLPNPMCGLMPLKDQDFFQEIFSHIKAKKHSSLFQKTVDEMDVSTAGKVDELNVQAETFMASLQRVESTQHLNLKELKKELKQTILGIAQRLLLLAPIKESWEKTMERLEHVCAECQRHCFNTEHNLVNAIRELELQKILREEAEERAANAIQSAEEAKAKVKEAITARTLESKKVKKALEDMAAADEELTRAKTAAVETEGKLLESNKTIAEMKEKLSSSEFALFQLQQKVSEDNERTKEAKEKMVLALEIADKRVKAFEVKTRELEKKIEEAEQAVAVAEMKAAAEEERATGFLAELERFKEETEMVKEHARETLLESSKKMSAMEDRVAEITEMLAAVQHKASSAQHRAVMAEKRLLAILASAKRAVRKKNFAAGNAAIGIQAMEPHLSVVSNTHHGSEMLLEKQQNCSGSEDRRVNVGAHQTVLKEVEEVNYNIENRKQETDVWPITQEILVHLQQQSFSIYSGLYSDHGGWELHTPLLDALNLEHSSSCPSFGRLQGLRQLSLGHSQLEGEKHSSSTEDRRTQKTSNRNSSQEAVEEQRLSPESEAQTPASALSDDEDYAPCSSLRTLLNQFVLPRANPSCPSLGSLTRSPHCIIAPTMPTLPEEEEGGEDQERMQSSSSSILGSDPRMSETPAIVLPDITSSPDRELDQTSQIRSHSPIQRRSSRNSRTSFSSTSSLTSVDGDGHIYDLVNDKLPEVQLSDEDKKKNAELLEEAKKISERFLTRRCRRSRTSTSDSPPALTPSRTPIASPSPSRSNSVTIQPQIDPSTANCVGTMVTTSTQAGEKPPPSPNREKEMKLLEVPGTREQDIQLHSEKHTRKLSPTRKTVEARKLSPAPVSSQVPPSANFSEASMQPVSLGTDVCRESKPMEKSDHVKVNLNIDSNGAVHTLGSPTKLGTPEYKEFPLRPSQPLASELATPKPVPEHIEQTVPRSRMPCRAEIKSFSSQPLLRAISWECLEVDEELSSPPQSPPKAAEKFGFSEVFDASQLKASNCKDSSAQPKMQKLAKLREENKMMRNQNLSALRLPDLSETIEQDRGPSPIPCPAANGSKGNSDITPNIPDSLLRKLKVHRSLPGGPPPLTEKEIENTFIQLSLAFKNDSYTLETRLGLAERERNLAEENTEKELENFKTEMKSSTSLWVHPDQRDAQQRLLETITVLQRLAIRLSGRAEMVGAVRQEKRMSKATEVMMQYVENLKRMYEKDHAELTEFKKLANQNSNRTYGTYGDSSDDGVPRTARSMSLTLGKTVPRRRVSVAVVPKFINFPGQPAIVTMAETTNNASSSSTVTTTTIGPSSSSSLNASSSSGINMYPSPTLAPLAEHGKQNADKENKCPTPGKVQSVKVEITSSETKAKIEEEAYNKGYQEGLKAQLSQEQKELHDIPEKVEEHNTEKQPELNFKEERKCSKFEEVSELIDRLCPKCLRHRSAIWIVGAVVLFFAVLISIFSSIHYPCSDLSDTPNRKSSCSAVQKYLWPFSGSRHKNRAQV